MRWEMLTVITSVRFWSSNQDRRDPATSAVNPNLNRKLIHHQLTDDHDTGLKWTQLKLKGHCNHGNQIKQRLKWFKVLLLKAITLSMQNWNVPQFHLYRMANGPSPFLFGHTSLTFHYTDTFPVKWYMWFKDQIIPVLLNTFWRKMRHQWHGGRRHTNIFKYIDTNLGTGRPWIIHQVN